MNTSCVADRTRPGELLRLAMNGLTSAGYDVRPPDHDESCRMTIACPGARCTLVVNDHGYAEWKYCPRTPEDADPQLSADRATTLLTGRPGPFPFLERGHGNGNGNGSITFKGIVGLELKARGLDVELALYRDEECFDAFAEIVATTPGGDDAGDDEAKVRVTDDGCVTRTRSYWAEAATIAFEPDFCGWIADPASVAASVLDSVTRAMSCLSAVAQGRAA